MKPIIPYILSMSMTTTNKIKVFTPTLEWSSYLIGMLNNSNIEQYVGVDVIKKVCVTTEKIANSNNIKNKIYFCPSENLYYDKSFMKKYKSYFDFIFFSPPYYQLELYNSEKQSTNTYNSYEEWLEKYWSITMKLCYSIIKNNKYLMYIITGYTLNKQYINLEKDLVTITKNNGFIYLKKVHMKGKNIGSTKHRESKGSIYIFVKNENENKKDENKKEKLMIKTNC